MKNLILIFFVFLCFIEAKSQAVETAYGFFGGMNYNIYNASFSEIPGFSKPPATFSASNEIGIHFGAFFQIPITEKVFLLPRISYFQSPSQLEAFEPTTFIVFGVPTPGVFKHTISAQLATVSFEALFGYRLFSTFDLFAGSSIGYYLGNNFNQTEEVFTPDSVRFLPGVITRNPRSGEIPNVTLQSFVIGGAKYSFASNNLIIGPEISYYYPLQNISESVNWNYSSIRLSISIGRILKNEPNVLPIQPILLFDTLYIRDTIVKTTTNPLDSPNTVLVKEQILEPNLITINEKTFIETLLTTIKQQYITYKYTENKKVEKLHTVVPKFKITKDIQGFDVVESSIPLYKKIQKTTVPLLPYIFFDFGSTDVPNKYLQIEHKLLPEKTIDIYYSILPIVARRLKENLTSTITVIGYVSNENGLEQSKELANARAISVKNLLVQLGVNPKQILLSSGLLPTKPSRSEIKEGNEENRRVEIWSSNNSILSPVTIVNSSEQYDETPLFLVPEPRDKSIISQEFEITIGSNKQTFPLKNLKVVSDKTVEKYYSFPVSLVPKSPEELKELTQSDITIELRSFSSDTIFQTTKKVKVVVIDTIAQENEVLSVLLFDFDSSELTQIMKDQLKDYSEKDFSKRKIEFRGSTDIMGSEQYNKELSYKRALSVSKIFNGNNSIFGFGVDTTTFDNNLPEGRFYSRTVKIEIR